MDFRKLKNYAYGTRRGLSPQRWCLTGESGLFLDPVIAIPTGDGFWSPNGRHRLAAAKQLGLRAITGLGCQDLARRKQGGQPGTSQCRETRRPGMAAD